MKHIEKGIAVEDKIQSLMEDVGPLHEDHPGAQMDEVIYPVLATPAAAAAAATMAARAAG